MQISPQNYSIYYYSIRSLKSQYMGSGKLALQKPPAFSLQAFQKFAGAAPLIFVSGETKKQPAAVRIPGRGDRTRTYDAACIRRML